MITKGHEEMVEMKFFEKLRKGGLTTEDMEVFTEMSDDLDLPGRLMPHIKVLVREAKSAGRKQK